MKRWISLAALALLAQASHASSAQNQLGLQAAQAQTMPGFDCVTPASPHPVQVTQPDGRTVTLRLRGNGLFSWYEDTAGYPVVRRRDAYLYAVLTPQGELFPTTFPVGTVRPERLGLSNHTAALAQRAAQVWRESQARGRKAQPDGPGSSAFVSGSGSVDNLVLLLRFGDHGPGGQNRTLPSAANFDTIMNAVGGDPGLAPTGSVRDHYIETSYNQFFIDSTSHGWFDMPEDEIDYANGNSGLTSKTWDLITDGLNAADPSVDFSLFDQDGNGIIDAITFLHSGYGAEWGGTDSYDTHYTDRMWSHKWAIPTWVSAEGVSVSEYNISPGLWATSGSSPGRIGVVAHELGHFFGLPDLYDTNGGGQGIGNWCVMAAGSWGFDGSQQYPSHMSAWSKMKMGWVTPQWILPGSYSALQVEDNQTIFRIDSGYPPGEYLLIENRQQTLFDSVIPQGGLAVWHVDDAKGSMGFNDPNTDQGDPLQGGWPGNNNHYRVALLQADDDWDLERNVNRGDSGDPYHAGGVNQVTGASSPNLQAYQLGAVIANDNRLTGIGASSSSIGFDYDNPSAPQITTGSLGTIELGDPYLVNLSASGGAGSNAWTEFYAAPSYGESQSSSGFATVGVAQGWNADDDNWSYLLPFPFPFYENTYEEVWISSNGFIDFIPGEAEPANQPTHLKFSARIAPLWDDLRTDGGGEDIFIDSSVADEVTIRWRASTFSGGNSCNFSVTLHADGDIDFHYGGGNTGISPTVGISRGHTADLIRVAGYDSQGSLTNEDTYEFSFSGSALPPGLVLDSSGMLSGVPTVQGTYAFEVRVTDANQVYDQRPFTLDVIVDCNNNAIDDAIDISMGTSLDCNSNQVPDECEGIEDCNGNGLCDADDIASGRSRDADGNGVPDDCQIQNLPVK